MGVYRGQFCPDGRCRKAIFQKIHTQKRARLGELRYNDHENKKHNYFDRKLCDAAHERI